MDILATCVFQPIHCFSHSPSPQNLSNSQVLICLLTVPLSLNPAVSKSPIGSCIYIVRGSDFASMQSGIASPPESYCNLAIGLFVCGSQCWVSRDSSRDHLPLSPCSYFPSHVPSTALCGAGSQCSSLRVSIYLMMDHPSKIPVPRLSFFFAYVLASFVSVNNPP